MHEIVRLLMRIVCGLCEYGVLLGNRRAVCDQFWQNFGTVGEEFGQIGVKISELFVFNKKIFEKSSNHQNLIKIFDFERGFLI